MTKRAYGLEDKQVRREDILDAARRLFAAGTGDLPAVADIAAAAGLAKGTVYLYFSTREAIFAELLLEGWGALVRELGEAFGNSVSGPEKVSRFLSRLVAYMDHHPELLRLDALGHGVVERNLEPKTLLDFKNTLNRRLMGGGAVVEVALDLPPGRGVQLLMRTYALTRGLWQAMGSDGVAIKVDFTQELAEALDEYWRGALADTPSFRR